MQALILDGGDPRNAIASTAEAGKDSQLKFLLLSLNDEITELVSRAGLLLLMVKPYCSQDTSKIEKTLCLHVVYVWAKCTQARRLGSNAE